MSELNSNENRLAELKKLGELKEAGLLSDEEFEAEKNRLLNARTESLTNGPVQSERYEAGSYKSKSSVEWSKIDMNSFGLALKRGGFLWLGTVVLLTLFPDPAITIFVYVVLIEIVLLIVSKLIGKRIGIFPILRSWLFREKKQ